MQLYTLCPPKSDANIQTVITMYLGVTFFATQGILVQIKVDRSIVSMPVNHKLHAQLSLSILMAIFRVNLG